jgi:hypothetical protein
MRDLGGGERVTGRPPAMAAIRIAQTMKRLLLAGIAVLVTWMLLDTLAHRLLLEPLYASSPSLWRPLSEMNPVLIGAVTVLLIAVFLAAYQVLVRPKSLATGLCFGGLLGVALGASAGFGTYIHSPIPLTLAWGWFGLGTVKGVVAGILLGALIQEGNHA